VGQITANIAQLGFRVADVKILTAVHGHFHHVAGLAQLEKLTTAQLVMSAEDAPRLESGGNAEERGRP
jgi:metallo-beta-lactamase class B